MLLVPCSVFFLLSKRIRLTQRERERPSFPLSLLCSVFSQDQKKVFACAARIFLILLPIPTVSCWRSCSCCPKAPATPWACPRGRLRAAASVTCWSPARTLLVCLAAPATAPAAGTLPGSRCSTILTCAWSCKRSCFCPRTGSGAFARSAVEVVLYPPAAAKCLLDLPSVPSLFFFSFLFFAMLLNASCSFFSVLFHSSGCLLDLSSVLAPFFLQLRRVSPTRHI